MIYVLSQAFEQPVVTSRLASGLAATFHPTKIVWAPAFYKYCGTFTVKEARGSKNWTLCLAPDGTPIAPEAAQDNQVRVIPDGKLDTVLTGQRLTAANNWVANADFNLVFQSGITVRDALIQIGQAMGHTPEFQNALS